jgi:hypothetical protein
MKTRSILALAIIALLAGTAAEAKYSGGTGEPNDPYQIATAEDLNDIGNHEEDFNKHFILVNDVNLAQYTGTQFKIIGRWIEWGDPNNKPFTGVFDGNGNRVWNFTYSSTGKDSIGLFRFVGEKGQIKNLGMENVDVNALNGEFVGGLVGYCQSGSIINCYSTGAVSGGFLYVGGLVGENDGSISNCYSTGAVSGSLWSVGGLVGSNWFGGTVSNCYSTGAVSGTYGVGGLVGDNDSSISNCYSTGAVSGGSGSFYVGGLVGLNAVAGNIGSISNCYSTGAVSGSTSVGGLVGGNGSGSVINSFWDTQTSGWMTSAGGEGKTTAEMKTLSTFTSAGWDFVEIWGIGENQTYPYLRTEPAGDLNHDKKVDFEDLAILALHWLEGTGP